MHFKTQTQGLSVLVARWQSARSLKGHRDDELLKIYVNSNPALLRQNKAPPQKFRSHRAPSLPLGFQKSYLLKCPCAFFGPVGDRKSTRLNSSHGYISYAVFSLEK